MPNYRYNGIELPALPEYDKVKYPYATIVEHLGTFTYHQYIFVVSAVPMYVDVKTTHTTLEFDENNFINFRANTPYENPLEWSNLTQSGGINILIEKVVWANFDILNQNGSVYLPASDPVPVPTPQDFYTIKNGVGQKQDVYLRVGGQWVKQDEYLI